ncbi:MAG: Gldg family protein [Acidobacteria bacterium]|nr:Gldg family protein [Acidobacteriota bacterium]
MASRQVRYTAYAGAYIIVFVAILAGINFLANRYNKSFDSTTNKRFSLSDQTEKIVKGLATEVKITVVDKTDRFIASRDLLDRYSNLSSKLRVDYIDPEKSPQLARALGARSFGQVFVENGIKREEARALTEEEVTGAIIRTLKTGDRMVCSLSGAGESGFDEMTGDGLGLAKTALERYNYKTQVIKTLQKAEIPADCTTILVAGPRFDYPEPVVAGIKAFVEKGGHAMFLLAPALKTEKDDGAVNEKLVALLDSWGITVNNDVAIDESGSGVDSGFNKFVFVIDKYESHPIVRDMRDVGVAFPLVRTLTTKDKAEKLIATSDKSFATTTLDLKKLSADPPAGPKGPLPIAAAASIGKARIVVFGSISWATNSFFRYPGNRDLFLNAFNWMSSDEELISIRPKEPEDRRLNVKPGQGWVFPFASFFPPILIIIGGIMVWLRRR